jgi:hypothetical protein
MMLTVTSRSAAAADAASAGVSGPGNNRLILQVGYWRIRRLS